MTNQTIDGVLVPRELLSYWAECLESAGFKDRPAEMRALLDAKPVMCHGCMAEGVSPDHFDSDGKCKAAQPQGEPVANPVLAYADSYRAMQRQGAETVSIWSVITDLERNIAPLYAEQPAPVAVVLPERLNHSDGLHTYEYVTGHNDCIDKMLGIKS